MTGRSISALAARLYDDAYVEFGVAPPEPRDRLAYATTIAGRVAYLACLGAAWILLNAATLFFGVYVEPPWRPFARFRRLQLPGRIPVIAIALPILLGFAAFRTWRLFGVWHVIGPFLFVAASVVFSIAALALFNAARSRLSVAAGESRP